MWKPRREASIDHVDSLVEVIWESCVSLKHTYSLCICISGNTLYISLQVPVIHSRWNRANIKDKDCFSMPIE